MYTLQKIICLCVQMQWYVGLLLEATQHSERSQDNSPNERVLHGCKMELTILSICRSFSHPQTTTGDDVKDFAKQIKNKLTRRYRRRPPKKTYLDYVIERGGEEREGRDTAQSLVFNNVHTRINNMAQRSEYH